MGMRELCRDRDLQSHDDDGRGFVCDKSGEKELLTNCGRRRGGARAATQPAAAIN